MYTKHYTDMVHAFNHKSTSLQVMLFSKACVVLHKPIPPFQAGIK